MQRIIVATLILLLTGCATNQATLAKRAEFERTIPTCSGGEDCTAKWEAAQLWVVHNAGYKIQTSTSVLIETYSPHNTKSIGVQVTKEPLGGGKYKILANIWCDSLIGCNPDVWDAAMNFNKTVSAAAP